MSSPQWRTPVVTTLLILVVLYSAVLRLDALFKSYGPYDAPRWLASMQPAVRAAASTLTPDWPWPRVATPYVGSDAINYLKFARAMRSFYAAHAREPMFPAATRVGLMLTGDADVGISLTSITFGLLTLVATYALGASMASPPVGLAAAAMMGIDHTAVLYAIEGWRDEMFACLAISAAWAWIRFARSPSTANAVLVGAISGAACLTRITAISLIAPAVVWLLGFKGTAIRRELAIAVGTMAILVSPFLVNCALATGDPLYALNNHTDFFLKREGTTPVRPISAVRYTLDRFESRPIAATDTVVRGIFVYPFANKWGGLDHWYSGLGRVLACLAMAGLVAWLWLPEGRFALLMLFGAIVPFSVTWTVPGGAEWRFTSFAYAFYLIAAFWAVDRIARAARQRPAPSRRQVLRAVMVVSALVTVTGVWLFAVPTAVAIEPLTYGEPAMIAAGPRDRWFFANGWSGLVVEGNVTSRAATTPAALFRMFLPEARAYALTLRLDPVDPSAAPDQAVDVSLNGNPLEGIVLGWNPARVGQYDLTIPAGAVTPGVQHLMLRSNARFKLWYVRITPQ